MFGTSRQELLKRFSSLELMGANIVFAAVFASAIAARLWKTGSLVDKYLPAVFSLLLVFGAASGRYRLDWASDRATPKTCCNKTR